MAMNRCKTCCLEWRDDWVRRAIGVAGSVVFWISAISVLIATYFRGLCTADAFVVPLLLLPTGIMGLFTSLFLLVFISFLRHEDTYDFMKQLTYCATFVTFFLQFITFGFSATKVNHPHCDERFYGYTCGMTMFLGFVLLAAFVLYGIHKYKSSKVQPSYERY